MKKCTGLWIDHREAFLVSIEGDHTMVHHLESGADSHFKATGGWKSGGTAVAQALSSEKKAEESRKHQYHVFYKQVIAMLQASSDIAIFGPGEAKIELRNEIEKNSELFKKVSVIESCDHLTENQIVAKVKLQFKQKL